MKYTNILKVLNTFLLLCMVFILSGCQGGSSHSNPYFGVIVFSSGWIGILDGKTQTVTTPLLADELQNTTGDTLDVAISPDGKTTLVSRFHDNTVFFIDTSNPANPVLSGSVTLSFHAEDIAMTPDGRYALVTDGAFTSSIGVIDVDARTLVEEFDDSTHDHTAIAVAEDGVTVLSASYYDGLIHVFILDENGHLTYVNSIDVTNDNTLLPINLTISPDGKTVIVASVISTGLPADMAFPVLTITGPGEVTLTDMVTPTSSTDLVGSQSIVFNREGTKAYLICAQEYIADPAPNNVIMVLNITEPGVVSDAGEPMMVDFYETSQLFGVDTLAMDYSKGYLYVSNMVIGNSENYIQVLEVETGTVVDTITFDPVPIGDPQQDTDAFPVGISFLTPEPPTFNVDRDRK